MRILILFIFFVLVSVEPGWSQRKYESTWESIDSRPIPSWFENAKFGIFIHWGLYSVPSYAPTIRDSVSIHEKYAEHYWRRLLWDTPVKQYFKDFHNRVYGADFKYRDFVCGFKAEMFNAKDWANCLKNSGAKYVVITAKHHEGFALWPSKYSPNWNSVDIGPHMNLLKEVSDAVKEEGLKMGVYYSLLEWFHPLYKKETIEEYVDQYMIPQMKELVTDYNPHILWTDGEWDYLSKDFKSTDFLQWLYNDSPVKDEIVVNDRWGKETRGKNGGFFTTEYGLGSRKNTTGKVMTRPWEECRGIGGSFGYKRNEILEDYSTSKELIHLLIDKVARGGNLLLNIGPTADGRIPVIMQQRLYDIGQWLQINGEAIYNTEKWNNAPDVATDTKVFYTSKNNDLYVLSTTWPEEPIQVEGINRVGKVSMLGYEGKVKYTVSKNNLNIVPPNVTPANNPSQHAWVFKVENIIQD